MTYTDGTHYLRHHDIIITVQGGQIVRATQLRRGAIVAWFAEVVA
jgi:hypothetical protein